MTKEPPNDRLNRLFNQLRITALPDSVRRNLASIPHATTRSPLVGHPSRSTMLREIIADLVHDAFGPLAISGARSAATAARDVVHRWEDNDLVLTIPIATGPSAAIAIETDDHHQVQGQIFGPNESRWHISVSTANGTVTATPATDSEGSFSFAVAAGEVFTVMLTDDVVAVRCGPISIDHKQ